jgi:hypothetical protein
MDLEFETKRTGLANAFADAGEALMEYMGTDAALAAIPNTDPQQYVVAGTLPMIAKMLPGVEPTSPAVAPSQVPPDMLEEIAKSWDGCWFDDIGGPFDIGDALREQFKKVRLSAVREARNEAQWVSVEAQLPPTHAHVLVWSVDLNSAEMAWIDAQHRAFLVQYEDRRISTDPPDEFSHWMHLPQPPASPAASKEGDSHA